MQNFVYVLLASSEVPRYFTETVCLRDLLKNSRSASGQSTPYDEVLSPFLPSRLIGQV
jgi:hypothetical protein